MVRSQIEICRVNSLDHLEIFKPEIDRVIVARTLRKKYRRGCRQIISQPVFSCRLDADAIVFCTTSQQHIDLTRRIYRLAMRIADYDLCWNANSGRASRYIV